MPELLRRACVFMKAGSDREKQRCCCLVGRYGGENFVGQVCSETILTKKTRLGSGQSVPEENKWGSAAPSLSGVKPIGVGAFLCQLVFLMLEPHLRMGLL
eukprot:gene20288-14843_t